MDNDLQNIIVNAEIFIDEYDKQENYFITTIIETADADNCIVLRQTILGWVDSVYIAPGTFTRLGVEKFLERLNNVFEASAVKISSSVISRYLGDISDAY